MDLAGALTTSHSMWAQGFGTGVIVGMVGVVVLAGLVWFGYCNYKNNFK